MAGKPSKPGAIHLRIIKVMKRFPAGISGGQIRQELEKEGLRPEDQTHLDRRKRDLKKWFLLEKKVKTVQLNGKSRKVTLYRYAGERTEVADQGNVDVRTRYEVILAAHGRCTDCGRTIEKHGIALVVDHRVPRDWGGTNDRSNLHALCEECNAGKKAYYSSLNAAVMSKVMAHESVHVRIGELLKAVGVGKRTLSSLLDLVAGQDDWQKRVRELRYPVIGWKIDTRLYKTASGRKQADYVLVSFRDWPDNPSQKIRCYEKDRGRKNARTKKAD